MGGIGSATGNIASEVVNLIIPAFTFGPGGARVVRAKAGLDGRSTQPSRPGAGDASAERTQAKRELSVGGSLAVLRDAAEHLRGAAAAVSVPVSERGKMRIEDLCSQDAHVLELDNQSNSRTCIL